MMSRHIPNQMAEPIVNHVALCLALESRHAIKPMIPTSSVNIGSTATANATVHPPNDEKNLSRNGSFAGTGGLEFCGSGCVELSVIVEYPFSVLLGCCVNSVCLRGRCEHQVK